MSAQLSKSVLSPKKNIKPKNKLQQLPRDFFSLLEKVKDTLPKKNCNYSTLGEIRSNSETYPIIKIVLGAKNPKRVLITAGIHGDELAGVNAILAFLEQKLFKEYIKEWELTIIPCINPTGYALNTRNNHEDNDLNRLFRSDSPPQEVSVLQSVLDSPFDLTLDLHEDLDTPGLYIYMKELKTTDTTLGKKIINAMKEFMPINLQEEIEETPAKGGLISDIPDPEGMDWWPLVMYAIDRGSKTSFTLETSTDFSMETRVNCHISAIQTALRNHTNWRKTF
jgi:protein MpaA